MTTSDIETRYTVFVRPRMMSRWERADFSDSLEAAKDRAVALYNAGNYDAQVYDNALLRAVYTASLAE